ncbi:MAG TPA: SUF system NifU family Fe-S cluster assembly protein [Gemmatimonadales bacterium]|nr:SUF system NifU family Fe-S cluster assembly protein [Gemmatimonadales bacterium]
MADLAELYQQVIIDHNRNPRNFRAIADANRTADGDNPLCGDRISLYVKVENGTVADIGFQGKGCAISQASASLMTGAVKGKTIEEAERLFQAFHSMVTSDGTQAPDTSLLGKLAAFAGVRQFPARVKCANLAWHTLHAALAGDGKASTE